MTDFVKVKGSDRATVMCLAEKVQGISAAKVMECVFIGPQSRKFLQRRALQQNSQR